MPLLESNLQLQAYCPVLGKMNVSTTLGTARGASGKGTWEVRLAWDAMAYKVVGKAIWNAFYSAPSQT